MESLMIDRTKIVTVSSYARIRNVSVQQVYNWINDGKVKEVIIDGVKFVER